MIRGQEVGKLWVKNREKGGSGDLSFRLFCVNHLVTYLCTTAPLERNHGTSRGNGLCAVKGADPDGGGIKIGGFLLSTNKCLVNYLCKYCSFYHFGLV